MNVLGDGGRQYAAAAPFVPEPPPGRATPPDRFLRGMALGLFSGVDPGRIARSLDELERLGVNSVSLVVPKSIRDVRSADFHDGRWATPPDDVLREAIRQARARGIQVMLFPLVNVEELGAGEWRGTLAPPDWDVWFQRYGAMILHYARLAEREGVELLSVGAELCSTEGFQERWIRLIGDVRRTYRGRILYSANWDHYREVSFAGALDFLGINAYYRLTEDANPRTEELRRAWEPIRAEIREWAVRHGRRLVFTEVGYPSREGAATDPWNYTAERPASAESQRRCYRAFAEAWRDVPELAGAFFYLWWGEGGPGDRGYTPRGKPAASEVARWFRGMEMAGRAAEDVTPLPASGSAPH